MIIISKIGNMGRDKCESGPVTNLRLTKSTFTHNKNTDMSGMLEIGLQVSGC